MKYECTIIVPGNLDEAASVKEIAAVKALIEKHKGTVLTDRNWGRRQLAYPINKEQYGYYNTFEFEAEGETVGLFERDLRLAGKLLRWLTTVAYDAPVALTDGPKPVSEDTRSAEEQLRRTSATTTPVKRARKVAEATPEDEDARQKQLDEALGKLLAEDETVETKENE